MNQVNLATPVPVRILTANKNNTHEIKSHQITYRHNDI